MGIDLTKIDEEIKRLNDIRRLMSDPKSVALVEELLSGRNGSGPIVQAPASARVLEQDENSQTSRVRRVVAKQSGEFTVITIWEALRGTGPEVEKEAVGKVLTYLAKKTEIAPLHRSQRGRMNTYRKTERLKV